jgi:major membrane immunogen (membrane-anchored lipoprotein)
MWKLRNSAKNSKNYYYLVQQNGGTMKKIIITAIIAISAFTLTACSDSKPSKSAVNAGYYKAIRDSMSSSTDDETIHAVSDCIIDKVYDDLSTVGAKTIANGDEDGGGTDKDSDLIENAADECGDELR